MKPQKLIVTMVLAVALASLPAVAFGLEVNFGFVHPTTGVFTPISPFPTTTAADCTIPSGQTKCTVTVNIPNGDFSGFRISSGGTAKAIKQSNGVNKVTVSNLTIQWRGTGAVRFGVTFFHGFTNVPVTTVSVGQAASGNFCRADANGNCQNAAPALVQLNSTLTFIKNNGDQIPNSLPQTSYNVSAGGISLNNYFPTSVLPSTSGTFSCSSGCQNTQFIGSQLTFQMDRQFDAVVQKATHFNVSVGSKKSGDSAQNLAKVQNELNAEAVMSDIQPIFHVGNNNLDNNDWNLGSGNRQVAVYSQVDPTTTPPRVIFNPNSIDLNTVLIFVGDQVVGTAPSSVNLSAGDLNGDGINDVIFSFDSAEVEGDGGRCLPEVGGIYVISGMAEFVSKFTQGGTIHDQIDFLEFNGSQPFVCSPRAT